MDKRIALQKTILILGDIFLAYISLLTALEIREGDFLNHAYLEDHLFYFSFVFSAWLIVFFVYGLYELGRPIKKSAYVKRFSEALGMGVFLAIALFYVVGTKSMIAPKTILAIISIVFFILSLSWHFLYRSFLKMSFFGVPVAAIGLDKSVVALFLELEKNKYLGYRPALVFDKDKKSKSELMEKISCPVIAKPENLKKIIRRRKVKLVILSPEVYRHRELMEDELFRWLPLKMKYINLADFYESVSRKVFIGAVGKLWFLENFARNEKSFYELIKRLADIICSIIGMVATVVFSPFIIFAIKWESAGPIFIHQSRVGRNGKIFDIVKFRTMYAIAPDGSAEIGGPVWCAKNKDRRVTRAGAFLRKTRIDEWPQFINVFSGKMSLIGPRPERPEFVDTLKKDIPFYNQRHLIKPGLTGWAQINIKHAYAASVKESLDKLQYDLYYVKNRSFLLDLEIVLRTIKIILGRK